MMLIKFAQRPRSVAKMSVDSAMYMFDDGDTTTI